MNLEVFQLHPCPRWDILDGMNDRDIPRFRIQIELKSMAGKRYKVVVAGQWCRMKAGCVLRHTGCDLYRNAWFKGGGIIS